ncbi:serine/threonine protein kinase [Microcoleus sp. FACHB-1515]|nr:serine/threonine protein kinase [Microcoleus sp. FACHB-1515]
MSRTSNRSQYRILGLVGQGQYGRVYCAVHCTTGRLVALKLLEPQFPTRQFLRELRFLLSVDHPNIVACRAIEHMPQGRSLVMDYCEGGTLRSLLSKTRIPPLQAVQLVCNILAGLDHAHARGIVHCDIKPENVLLSIAPTGWNARLSDFGIARLSQECNHPGSGQTGSPAYMAPERFYGQYSVRSDLYSVGVILFELLTGDRPFSGTPLELMSAHLNDSIDLSEVIPDCLQSIVKTALQKLPARRFDSAAQMQTALLKAASQLQNSPLLLPRSIAPASAQLLSERIDYLAASASHRYWVTSSPRGIRLHRDKTETIVPEPVRSLLLRPQGCFVLTKTALHLQPIDSTKLQLIRSIAPETQVAIAPNGRWFVAVSPEAIKIQTVAGGRSIVCPVLESPAEVVMLSSRHFAIVRHADESNTQIEVWTRQGRRMVCFEIAAALSQITPSQTQGQFLAIDRQQPNQLLQIDVKPFRLQRIDLPIAPCSIAAGAWGYACASAQGEIVLLDLEGQPCEQIDGIGAPTVIAAIDSQLEIATWSTEIGHLYRFDFSTLISARL